MAGASRRTSPRCGFQRADAISNVMYFFLAAPVPAPAPYSCTLTSATTWLRGTHAYTLHSQMSGEVPRCKSVQLCGVWILGTLLRSLRDRHVGHKPTEIQQAGYFIMVFLVSLSLHVLAGIKIKPTELQRAYKEREILCREAKQINAVTP